MDPVTVITCYAIGLVILCLYACRCWFLAAMKILALEKEVAILKEEHRQMDVLQPRTFSINDEDWIVRVKTKEEWPTILDE